MWEWESRCFLICQSLLSSLVKLQMGQAAQHLHFWDCEVKICQVGEEEQTAERELDRLPGYFFFNFFFKNSPPQSMLEHTHTKKWTHAHMSHVLWAFMVNNPWQSVKNKIIAHIKYHKTLQIHFILSQFYKPDFQKPFGLQRSACSFIGRCSIMSTFPVICCHEKYCQ